MIIFIDFEVFHPTLEICLLKLLELTKALRAKVGQTFEKIVCKYLFKKKIFNRQNFNPLKNVALKYLIPTYVHT